MAARGSDWQATRDGEIEAPLPRRVDAPLVFIGRIRTPFATRDDCPRQGRPDGPLCRIEVDEPWRAGLRGIEAYETIEVLYFMDQARRDLIVQNPKSNGVLIGVFAFLVIPPLVREVASFVDRLPDLIVPFKRPVYEKVVQAFRDIAKA